MYSLIDLGQGSPDLVLKGLIQPRFLSNQTCYLSGWTQNPAGSEDRIWKPKVFFINANRITLRGNGESRELPFNPPAGLFDTHMFSLSFQVQAVLHQLPVDFVSHLLGHQLSLASIVVELVQYGVEGQTRGKPAAKRVVLWFICRRY